MADLDPVQKVLAIQARNQELSILLKLPAEIRLYIFDLILKDKHIHLGRTTRGSAILLPAHEPPPDFMRPFDATISRPTLLGWSGPDPNAHDHQSHATKVTPIWRTCRQIYNETIDMLYSPSNILSFDQSGLDSLRLLLRYHADAVQRLWLHDSMQIRGLLDALAKINGGEKSYSKQMLLLQQMDLAEVKIPTHISDVSPIFDVEAEEGRVEQLTMVLGNVVKKVTIVQV